MSPTPAWSLGTTAHEGRLDFVSALVELGPTYEARHVPHIEHALRAHTDVQDTWSRQVVGTIYHEAAHFLDLTTTNWGLEYTIRKLRLAQSAMAAAPDVDELADRLEVFMLSSAELGMHRHLAHTGDRSPAACDTLIHQVRVDPRFGPLIEIHYTHAGAMQHLVPLSMLSLLEAHATAVEWLARWRQIQAGPRPARLVEQRLFETEFQRLLGSADRLEYTVLLRLVQLHFEFLPLPAQLNFTAVLAHFCLDADQLSMVQIAQGIVRHTFADRIRGNAVVWDMSRGMSRHVLFFKLLGIVHGWMNRLPETARAAHRHGLKEDPLTVVQDCLHDLGYIDADTRTKLFDAAMERIESYGWPLDTRAMLAHAAQNRRRILQTPPSILRLDEVVLPDFLLHDGTPLAMPNRHAFDVESYFDRHLAAFARIESLFKTAVEQKFHVGAGGTPFDPEFQWVQFVQTP